MKLRSSWADLHYHLRTYHHSLGPLRLLAYLPQHVTHHFSLVLNLYQQAQLTYTPLRSSTWPADPWKLLSGTIPELLGSDTLKLDDGTHSYTADHLHDLSHPANYDNTLRFSSAESSGHPHLVLTGFAGSDNLIPWFDRPRLQEFLRATTWYGSLTHQNRRTLISINALAIQTELTHPGPNTLPDYIGHHTDGGATVAIALYDNARSWKLRHHLFGELSWSDYDFSYTPLRRAGAPGGIVEICELPEEAPYVAGKLLLTHTTEQCLQSAIHGLASVQGFSSYIRSYEQRQAQHQAQRLNERITALSRRPRAYYGNRELGALPANEQETVTLYCKLEGLNILPFYIQTSAWSAQEGIDAIADFRLYPDAAIQLSAPIEFEYQFANFQQHAHPHRHVRLVICWTSTEEDPDLQYTEYAWLRIFNSSSDRIPVVILDRLSYLDFTPEE